jgi:hypothetical protein
VRVTVLVLALVPEPNEGSALARLEHVYVPK